MPIKRALCHFQSREDATPIESMYFEMMPLVTVRVPAKWGIPGGHWCGVDEPFMEVHERKFRLEAVIDGEAFYFEV